MRITFIGAVRTVTGSQHLLEFQGKRKEAFEKNRSDFCKGESVDFLILANALRNELGLAHVVIPDSMQSFEI